MRALLLAAGIGTRLRPITETIPKCLVPIQGRPLLDYWLDLLFSRPIIERVLINTHHLSDRVRNHAVNSGWRDRIDVVYEPQLLGTAGTIKANLGYFGDEDFLVAHADNLTTFDLDSFIAGHRGRPAHCTMSMLTFRTDSPTSCGVLELDESGVVKGFHEKVQDPPGDLANAAVYMLTSEVANFVERLDKVVVDLSTEVIPQFVNRIFAIENAGYHRDIGTIESLNLANCEFHAGTRHAAQARDVTPTNGKSDEDRGSAAQPQSCPVYRADDRGDPAAVAFRLGTRYRRRRLD